MKPENRRRRRDHPYGVQVRLTPHDWAWIRPDGQPTRQPINAATWTGTNADASALEAARTLSIRNPGHTFRTKRF